MDFAMASIGSVPVTACCTPAITAVEPLVNAGPNGGREIVGMILVEKALITGVSSLRASSGSGSFASGGNDAPAPSVYSRSAAGDVTRYWMNVHAAFLCLLSAKITSWWPPSNVNDLPLGPVGSVVTPQCL